MTERESPSKTYLALVTFQNTPPHGDYFVRSSSFTTDVKEFGMWLGSIPLLGVGDPLQSDSSLVEGLCATLKVRIFKNYH